MPHVHAHSTQLFASVTSADLLRLGDEVDRLLAAGVDAIHLDVADGVFVPDLTFGLRTVRAVAEATDAPLDLHLMVERPEDVLRELAGIRPLRVAVHLEACPYPWRTLSLARSLGLTPGLALNPGTPIGALEDLGAAVSFVNLLSTEVDFAGERLLPGTERRISRPASCCRHRFASKWMAGYRRRPSRISCGPVPTTWSSGAHSSVRPTRVRRW